MTKEEPTTQHNGAQHSIKVVLLDVMDTIVKDPFFDEVPKFHGCDLKTLAQKMDREAWFAFERGELTEEEYRRAYFRDKSEVDLDGVKVCMKEGYVFLPGMEALLRDLCDANVALYALSNYPIWWRVIEEKLHLSRFLEWKFMSCRLKMRKPDPRLFEKVREELDLEASRCVFVDDRAVNCEGAKSIGMHAIEFKDASSLREKLRTLGVWSST